MSRYSAPVASSSPQLLGGAARSATSDDERAPSRPEHINRLRDRRGIRQQLPRWLSLQPFVQHKLRRHLRAQHVGGDFHIHRPGLAGVAHGPRHRLVEFANNLLRDAQGARRSRDRPQDVDMWNVLQRAHIGLRPRCAATDQQHRRSRQRRISHGGNGIGDARSRGRHGDAKAPGQLRMRMCHVDGGAFVTHVDDANVLARHMIPDRLDMPAL